MYRLLYVFIFIPIISFSQDVFYKGKVIPKVLISDAINESYSLYLPTTFNKDSLSPILFIFDPSGSGKTAINVFKETSEKFGLILIASNDAKNGPYDKNFEIANRLFESVFSTFKVNDKEKYLAGFSGGSRMASAIACLTNSFYGVIGCGASFESKIKDFTPNHTSNFKYVGVVGDEDMNYQEMYNAKFYLDKHEIDNTLITFSGGHQWPSSKEIDRAFIWFKINRIVDDSSLFEMDFVLKTYKDAIKRINTEIKNNNLVEAIFQLKQVNKIYSKIINTDSLNTKIKNIEKTSDYEEQNIKVKYIVEIENTLVESFINKFNIEVLLADSEDNFRWWTDELKKLDEKYLNNSNTLFNKMAKRIRYRLYALAIETSFSYSLINDKKRALYCDKLLVIQFPKKAYPYFRIAKRYAELKNHKLMYYNLEKALELGISVKKIKSDVVFNEYHKKARFKKLIENYNEFSQ